jgi:beta-phosphoglucomutase-like phosphatase (HAD superfamily)
VTGVDAILFDPVGTLGEFPAEPFQSIAAELFGRSPGTDAHGSQAYWIVVELLAACAARELEAVERAELYDDAGPALAELAGLGVRLVAASSLSSAALTRFVARAGLSALFAECWSRDRADGVGDIVLRRAVTGGAFDPGRVLFLADTEAGLQAAARANVRPILMMNEPDEAMRLTALQPAGGIVSLLELPDLVRFVAARQPRGESTA